MTYIFEGSNTYESTKFQSVHLTDNPSRCNKKSLRIILALIILGLLTVLIFSLCNPTNLPDDPEEEGLTASSISIEGNVFSQEKPIIGIFKKKWTLADPSKNVTDQRNYCEETEYELSAIPFNDFIHNNVQDALSNSLESFITIDLLSFYEEIINEHNPKDLALIFKKYNHELLSARTGDDFYKFTISLKSITSKFYMSILKKHRYTLNLNKLWYLYSITEEFYRWYSYLDKLESFLRRYVEQKRKGDYFTKITMESFTNFTEFTQEKLFLGPFRFRVTQKKLQEINKIVSDWTTPIKNYIVGYSVFFQNKIILSSEVNKKLTTLNASNIENIYIFASSVIYLDDDIVLLGFNVVIIAPHWVFLKKITINLDGVDGGKMDNSSVKKGHLGRPGYPGGNAGDFLGIGDINENFLKVLSRGGKGGDGENGGNGYDGLNNTQPSIEFKKPTCVLKMNSFKNPSNEIITRYRIYNEFGCGTSGADGGKGGIGGRGGKITIMSTVSEVKITKESDGVAGLPGKGGGGGAGGRNGCFFEALDLNNEVLHYVTKLACSENQLPSGPNGRDGTNDKGQLLPLPKINLIYSEPLINFTWFLLKEFSDNHPSRNSILSEFLSRIMQFNFLHGTNDTKYLMNEFEIFEKFNKMELYEVIINKIYSFSSINQSDGVKYLKSLTLGKMLILKSNVKFSFIDFNNYLDIVIGDIKNIEKNSFVGYFDSSKYLNRKISDKLNRIIENLKSLKRKLLDFDEKTYRHVKVWLAQGNGERKDEESYKHIGNILQKRRIIYVIQTVFDVLEKFICLSEKTSPINVDELRNFISRSLVSFERLENHKEEFFKSLPGIPSYEKTILSEMVASVSEYQEYNELLRNASEFYISLHETEIIILGILKKFSSASRLEEYRKCLVKIKDNVESLSELNSFEDDGKFILQDILSELEHFLAIYDHLEWKNVETSFLNSVKNLNVEHCLDCSDKDIIFLKKQVLKVLVELQYKMAIEAAQQKVYPFNKLNPELSKSKNLTISDEAIIRVNALREVHSLNTFCKNMVEGVFDGNSATGEFYYWPHDEIQNKLVNLIRGEEIELKAELINRHVLDKSFVRFKSLRVEFVCENITYGSSYCNHEKLVEILNNFKVELTHSGYSYYSWKGNIQVVVSEEINFDHSLKIRGNGDPEFYSSAFKKFQKGDIPLSPFSSWKIRILPYSNEADYNELRDYLPFIALRLVGTGTFISL